MSTSKPPAHWLIKSLPGICLTFCRAASQLEGGARILRDQISASRKDPSAIPPTPDKDTANRDLDRALSLVHEIAAEGWSWLLDALEVALEEYRVDLNWDAVSVIEEATDRWENWGTEEVHDLVLLLKGVDRVVSLSSGEVEMAAGPADAALATYRLQHVHLFGGFNRMRPVTGRRVEIQVASDFKSYHEAAGRFKCLLKTVREARRIGESRTLREFTPVGQRNGIRLWTFASLLGKFGSPEPIFAPPAGPHLEHLVPFRDRTGEVDLVFDPEVFNRSLRDFSEFNLKSPVTRFEKLSTWQGPSLVVTGWPFGSAYSTGALDRPTVVHWFPLTPDAKAAGYEALARIISTRKVSRADLDRDYPGWQSLLERRDIVEISEWVYYVPADCDPRLFQLYVEGGFRGVDPLKALSKLHVDGREWARFVSAYQRFFSYSPQDRTLYTAESPEVELERIYPKLVVEPPAPVTTPPRGADDCYMRSRVRESFSAEPIRTSVLWRTLSPESTQMRLAKNQILVNSEVLTLHDDLYVRVVSRENRHTPEGKLKMKVVETYDRRSQTLTLTREVWLAGAPESQRTKQVLSRAHARVERSGS
jgi:hypothetical protein